MVDESNPYESPTSESVTEDAPAKRGVPSLPVGIALCVVLTALYWFWESKQGGNIRIDLVFGYPLLLGLYIFSLQRLGWYALLIGLVLMVINYYFFTISYELFDKSYG